MHMAIALIALALGYKVFVDAQKEKSGLKRLGEIIGAVVMIAAFVCVLHGAAKCRGSLGCSMASKTATAGCPMMGMGSKPAK